MKPADLPRFVVGDRVPGTKWVVCQALGEGGMGVVFGVVKEPGIRGAMKVMHPQFARRSGWVSRFFEEVRLLASLEHPNIVQVFDFDRLDDGTPYVVMEWLRGKTLRQAQRIRKKSFPAIMAYEITRQLCEGLYRAHSHAPSVVHRDVKPANIFLHQPPFGEPVVKLVDFGVATLTDGKRDRGMYGTPLYMAPEQLRGESVTPKADIYAASLVLYEMLTGRLPWDLSGATTQRIVDAHLNERPLAPTLFVPWIPEAVERHILAALAKDPADRPRDAYAFVGKLFELQWVDDGSGSRAMEINTTAPMLSTLIEDEADPTEANDESAKVQVSSTPYLSIPRDTHQGMTPPPLDGRSLEPANALLQLRPLGGPSLSAATKVPTAGPSIDRIAPTGEWRAPEPGARRTDTEPLPLPAPQHVSAAPGTVPPLAFSQGETTTGSEDKRGVSIRPLPDASIAITLRVDRKTVARASLFGASAVVLAIAGGMGVRFGFAPASGPALSNSVPAPSSVAAPVAASMATATVPSAVAAPVAALPMAAASASVGPSACVAESATRNATPTNGPSRTRAPGPGVVKASSKARAADVGDELRTEFR